MKAFAIRGNLLFAKENGRLCIMPASYAVCENGKCSGAFPELPEQYRGLPVEDFGNQLIIPGYVDLHLHAPQYVNIGLGMDLELLDWLETFTFPEEARYQDLDYARGSYDRFVEDLRTGSTTRACIFATVHLPATVYLMEKLDQVGLHAFVGKVNMDRNSPPALCEEGAAASLKCTEEWLQEVDGRFTGVRPILTPRFVPSCSGKLMEGLGKIAARSRLPVQSHLSENLSEIEWVKELHPDCENYGSVYEKYGLLNDRTLMAHCVHLREREITLMRERGSYVVHCPTSNTNLRSGIAPIRKFMDAGLRIGLGSDISGGHTMDISRVIRETIAVSKHYWRMKNEMFRSLSGEEAFYLATRGGGAFFGKVGAFEEGFAFDAVVFDDDRISTAHGQDLKMRFDKMIYLCGRQDVRAKYVSGRRVR